jgi:hypothetical protein
MLRRSVTVKNTAFVKSPLQLYSNVAKQEPEPQGAAALFARTGAAKFMYRCSNLSPYNLWSCMELEPGPGAHVSLRCRNRSRINKMQLSLTCTVNSTTSGVLDS